MKDSRFLVIDKEILPDIFEKVIKTKELLRSNKVKGVTEATKEVGISRSAFYKYKDYVYTLNDSNVGRKVNLSFLLSHQAGVLSSVLHTISINNGNVLTINQDTPVNNFANVNIIFDITEINKKLDDIIQEIESINGVEKLEILALE